MKEKSFEEKLNDLEKIVKDLESGDTPLDEAINKFNEAMTLSGQLNKTLENATETINKVIEKDGTKKDFQVE